ncbi:MAG TPA: cytochrome c biogenesis protein CcsA [Candidatus Udaeobacter sp.]|jgi:cytochrome c-type biogenesis protein CcsB|nr:cytochrome c biogenesis protein CcsA [Candidatus Udaeobacter sp.]
MLFGSVGYGQSDPPAANSGGLDFKQFGLLAIQDGGRRKPIDTFAREMFIRITGRSTYTDKAGRKWQPNDFVLSALLDTRDWKNEPMVLISSGQLIEQLGLDKTQRRFSFAQLAGSAELQRTASEARALKRAEKPLARVQQESLSVSDRLALLGNVMNGNALLIVPSPQRETDAWMAPDPTAVVAYYNETQFAPAFAELTKMMRAYTQADAFNFSIAARQLQDNLRALSPSIYPQERQLRLEYFYNHFEGFYRAIWCYGIALVILIAAHLRKRGRALQNVGVAIALLGLAFHASGIVMRCMIGGRPPVTNMYESIIWVSFAVSFFGMIFFARYRTTVYLLAALPVTLIALLLVHQMPIAMPSSIDPLVPVLRDNFWLTVHVLTITLSYAAFALAMGFGHILLWRYARDPAAARADAPMHFWLYRVLQLGVLLLAAGTILGGVWANYSWGRFWGWDPKETWALIALLCYILALHGRLAGWWTQFGLAVASVVCFLAVLMAWYGVNFVLGKGLHSYGFGLGGETYVAIFVVLDLLFVAFAIWRCRRSASSVPELHEIKAQRASV